MDKTVKSCSPWVTYVHKLNALFGQDPDIEIVFDESEMKVKLLVVGADKAASLDRLLPGSITFGNVGALTIEVVPANKEKSKADLFRDAFEGNPLYSRTMDIQPDGTKNAFTYVMFYKKVVQYWNDNLGDPHGNVSMMAQDLATEIFSEDGVMYSTESF